MSSRHQPEHGADSPEALRDIFDDVADYLVSTTVLVASRYVEALTCDACDQPAVKDGFCAGHARLFEYTDHERSGGIAAND